MKKGSDIEKFLNLYIVSTKENYFIFSAMAFSLRAFTSYSSCSQRLASTASPSYMFERFMGFYFLGVNYFSQSFSRLFYYPMVFNLA